jgi:hypothetical protein
MLEYLKLITAELQKEKVPFNLHEEEKPGLTRWFPLTVWHDLPAEGKRVPLGPGQLVSGRRARPSGG